MVGEAFDLDPNARALLSRLQPHGAHFSSQEAPTSLIDRVLRRLTWWRQDRFTIDLNPSTFEIEVKPLRWSWLRWDWI